MRKSHNADAFFLSEFQTNSPSMQIKLLERQVSNSQKQLSISTTLLISTIQKQMMSPATLMLAGGIGFIAGELTKSRLVTNKSNATAGMPALKLALKFITSIQTLYTALPIAWLIKYHHPANAIEPSDRKANIHKNWGLAFNRKRKPNNSPEADPSA